MGLLPSVLLPLAAIPFSYLYANNIETASKCALWLEQLQESVKKTNDMFGLDISVDWRFPDAYEVKPEGGVQNERDNEPTRTVPEK